MVSRPKTVKPIQMRPDPNHGSLAIGSALKLVCARLQFESAGGEGQAIESAGNDAGIFRSNEGFKSFRISACQIRSFDG